MGARRGPPTDTTYFHKYSTAPDFGYLSHLVFQHRRTGSEDATEGRERRVLPGCRRRLGDASMRATATPATVWSNRFARWRVFLAWSAVRIFAFCESQGGNRRADIAQKEEQKHGILEVSCQTGKTMTHSSIVYVYAQQDETSSLQDKNGWWTILQRADAHGNQLLPEPHPTKSGQDKHPYPGANAGDI